MKRKLLIGLGGLTSLVIPITALSCACSSKSTTNNGPTEQPTNPTSPPEKKVEDKILVIKDNTLLLDLTKGKYAENFKNLSRFHSRHTQIAELVDEGYPEEAAQITKWYFEQRGIGNTIKVAIIFHWREEVQTSVYKVDLRYNPTPGVANSNSVEDIYHRFLVWAEKNRDKYIKSTNIEDFNNPDW